MPPGPREGPGQITEYSHPLTFRRGHQGQPRKAQENKENSKIDDAQFGRCPRQPVPALHTYTHLPLCKYNI